MKDDKLLSDYCAPIKITDEPEVERMRFDLKNYLVLRPFASTNFIFLKNESSINVEKLKN